MSERCRAPRSARLPCGSMNCSILMEGQGAHGRKDRTSHAWRDHELDMLNNMSRTLPPIFLLVSAFFNNLTLTRLVALEREQIDLLKALGYSNAAIVFHHVKFVALVVLTASSSAALPEPGLG